MQKVRGGSRSEVWRIPAEVKRSRRSQREVESQLPNGRPANSGSVSRTEDDQGEPGTGSGPERSGEQRQQRQRLGGIKPTRQN